MKKRRLALVFIVTMAVQPIIAQNKTVNIDQSSINWQGKKIGGQHEGTILLKSGSFELRNDEMVAGKFVVDMTSMTNSDLKDPGYNQKLVGHLKSDDFFGVEDHPLAKFLLTESSGFVNGKANVKGDITIKGTTKPVSFEVSRAGDEYRAKIEVDRSEFDVRYGSKSFFNNLGDKAIDDIFILDIKLIVN